MTIQELNGKQPKDLYTQIETQSFQHSLEFELTFRTLIDAYTKANQKDAIEKWCSDFIKCAIDQITLIHKRNNEITEDEKDFFVSMFLRKHKDYTLADIKLFANMVCSCELGDGLKAVDVGAINEKLVIYDQMRNNFIGDYYAKKEKEARVMTVGDVMDSDPSFRWDALKLRLKAYYSVMDEFLQWAQEYYDSIGYTFKGPLKPSRIPNFVDAIQNYLEHRPTREWQEYKDFMAEQAVNPTPVPAMTGGVQSVLF